MDRRGLTLIRLLVWILIVAGVLAVIFLFVAREQARARDAVRVADMARLAAAFELLRADRASYADAATNGCSQVGAGVSTCNLSHYLPTISSFRDPKGGAYVVTEVPSKDGYAVSFTLERGYRELQKGSHLLTPSGIR